MKIKYLFMIMVVFLVGCSNIKFDKRKAIEKLDEKFPNMLEMSSKELTTYYGLDLSKFKDYTFKISYDNPLNIYILILPNSKTESKKEIKKFFEKETKKDDKNKKRINSYYDNNIGEYLIYIVSDDSKKIYNELYDSFKE